MVLGPIPSNLWILRGEGLSLRNRVDCALFPWCSPGLSAVEAERGKTGPMQTSVAPEDIRTFVPPHPDPAPENLSPHQLASLMRTNNLRVWSQRAYEQEVVVRRFFGRSSVLFNAPEAIRHVLVDHPETYGRTRATLRILRPLLGQGLFTSEGATWRHQRRTLAPAFTPRPVELLIPHIRSATNEMISSLAAGAK